MVVSGFLKGALHEQMLETLRVCLQGVRIGWLLGRVRGGGVDDNNQKGQSLVCKRRFGIKASHLGLPCFFFCSPHPFFRSLKLAPSFSDSSS